MNQKCDVRLHVTCIIVSHDQFTIELEKVHAQILNKNVTYKYLLFMLLLLLLLLLLLQVQDEVQHLL